MLRDKLLKLRNFIRSHPYTVGILLVSLVFLFTPYYGVGYLGILAVSSRHLHPLKAFDSYLSNFLISMLLLCVSIMLAGIFAMLLHTPTYAIYGVGIYLALITPILNNQPSREVAPRFIVPFDIMIVLVSLMGPLLIIGSQLSGNSLDTALYKIVDGDGWDNASHLGILQLVEHYQGYIYPSAGATSGDVSVFSAYPQGWHLAVVNMVGGFGTPIFDTSVVGVFQSLLAYVMTIFTWFSISMYVFLKSGIYFYGKSIKKLNRKTLFIALIATSILPMLLIMLPSVFKGFANYIALIPYVLTIVCITLQFIDSRRTQDTVSYVSFTIPMLAGIALIWALPVPGLVLMCIYILYMSGRLKSAFLSLKKVSVLISLVLIAVPCLIYGYILLSDIGFEQVYVNTGFVAGFPKPMFALTIIAVILFGLYKKYLDLNMKKFMLILSPLTVYIFTLWILSYIKSGVIGYYQSKMFTLLVAILIMWAIPVIIRITVELSKSGSKSTGLMVLSFTSLCLVGGLVILSNNSLNLYSLKRGFIGDESVMKQAVEWTYRSGELGKGRMVIFDNNMSIDSNKSMLFNISNVHVAVDNFIDHNPRHAEKNSLKCLTPDLFYKKVGGTYSKDEVLDRLEKCLEVRSLDGLSTVIVSMESNRDYFDKINTYNAKFIYINK